MRAFAAAVLCGTLLTVTAQDKARTVRFVPWFGNHPLVLNADEKLPDGTPVRVTTFRFYAGVPVVNGDAQANLLPFDYQLVDAEDTASWAVPIPRSTSPFVLLGVDSLTNVSGAFGGDLDPIRGMYWAWNSGYIHCKIEGVAERSTAPRHAIEYHLGGYLPPHASSREVRLPVGRGLVLDLTEFLEAIKPAEQPAVNTPGPEAVRLCEVLARSFRMLP